MKRNVDVYYTYYYVFFSACQEIIQLQGPSAEPFEKGNIDIMEGSKSVGYAKFIFFLLLKHLMLRA